MDLISIISLIIAIASLIWNIANWWLRYHGRIKLFLDLYNDPMGYNDGNETKLRRVISLKMVNGSHEPRVIEALNFVFLKSSIGGKSKLKEECTFVKPDIGQFIRFNQTIKLMWSEVFKEWFPVDTILSRMQELNSDMLRVYAYDSFGKRYISNALRKSHLIEILSKDKK